MTPNPQSNLPLEHLIRPDSGKDARPPALFLLHGYGSNEADLFSFASELPEDLFVVSLRAPYSLQPFGYAWYSIDFNADRGKWNDVEQANASRDILIQTIDKATEDYKLDPGRISLLGFSQGSILSYSLALSYPERVKSLIALSGYVDREMLLPQYRSKDLSHLNTYASHGQSDMVIPLAWAQQSAEFLKSAGVPVTYEEYPAGHGVSQENLRSFLKWMQDKY